ncbi:MAG TPA: DUF642 domain-containing protein [Thermoanaerobaculaceae bacterium]|nr:DUF642 domain-containing protein [Thermoanaerobaculaceae bacterium]
MRTGRRAGDIEQTLDTTAGGLYQVMFFLAGNPTCGNAVKGLDVGATGNPTSHYTFDVTGHSSSSMGWQRETYLFVATGAITTLLFESRETSARGPALDNVAVTEVPPIPALSPTLGAVLALLTAVAVWLALARRAE